MGYLFVQVAKIPEYKKLILECRKRWDGYCANPTKANLAKVGRHLESMGASTSKRVQNERKEATKAYRAELRKVGPTRAPRRKKAAKKKAARRRRRKNPTHRGVSYTLENGPYGWEYTIDTNVPILNLAELIMGHYESSVRPFDSPEDADSAAKEAIEEAIAAAKESQADMAEMDAEMGPRQVRGGAPRSSPRGRARSPFIVRKRRKNPMSIPKALRVLGLEPGASVSEVSSAFRKKAKEEHPDRGGSAEAMGDINEARDVLVALGTGGAVRPFKLKVHKGPVRAARPVSFGGRRSKPSEASERRDFSGLDDDEVIMTFRLSVRSGRSSPLYRQARAEALSRGLDTEVEEIEEIMGNPSDPPLTQMEMRQQFVEESQRERRRRDEERRIRSVADRAMAKFRRKNPGEAFWSLLETWSPGEDNLVFYNNVDEAIADAKEQGAGGSSSIIRRHEAIREGGSDFYLDSEIVFHRERNPEDGEGEGVWVADPRSGDPVWTTKKVEVIKRPSKKKVPKAKPKGVSKRRSKATRKPKQPVSIRRPTVAPAPEPPPSIPQGPNQLDISLLWLKGWEDWAADAAGGPDDPHELAGWLARKKLPTMAISKTKRMPTRFYSQAELIGLAEAYAAKILANK